MSNHNDYHEPVIRALDPRTRDGLSNKEALDRLKDNLRAALEHLESGRVHSVGVHADRRKDHKALFPDSDDASPMWVKTGIATYTLALTFTVAPDHWEINDEPEVTSWLGGANDPMVYGPKMAEEYRDSVRSSDTPTDMESVEDSTDETATSPYPLNSVDDYYLWELAEMVRELETRSSDQ